MIINIIITTLVILLIAIFILFIIAFNNLQFVKNNINKSESNIKVLLKQRFDEIPQLVEVCKGYMGYENKTLVEITNLRVKFRQEIESKESEASNLNDIDDLDRELNTQMSGLRTLVEGYPDLKASEQFTYLSKRISALEDQISDRREFFNDSINVYNTRLDSFPDLLIAGMLKYKKREMFTITDEESQILTDINEEYE